MRAEFPIEGKVKRHALPRPWDDAARGVTPETIPRTLTSAGLPGCVLTLRAGR